MRRSRNFGPPIQVVVTRPSKTDDGLLSAWRFCSDETIQAELDAEVVQIRKLKEWIAKFKFPIDVANYQSRLFRVSRIRHLQALRANLENS